MGAIRYLSDKLVNLVANLGTDRDKASSSIYAPTMLSEQELSNAYRGAWLPRKIIDIPPLDATRRWRGWQASKAQIERIESEEKRLDVRRKVKQAMTRARLFGGAAIYIGTGDRDTLLPLDPENLQQGGIKYLTVLSKRKLAPGDIEQDPQSDLFDRPKWYTLTGSQIQVHPSRLIIFIGAELPDPELDVSVEYGWGDSVLQSILDTIKQSDSTMGNVASLVFEAKVDVIKIPDFMNQLQDKEFEKRVLERLRLAAMAKGINGQILLDAEEDYDSKSASFSSLPDVMDRFLQAVAGAADIPLTRLAGQSPAGMSSTGESDLRNYYDRIQAMQELDMRPALSVFDECLIRSALGKRDPKVHYTWLPLWQPTAAEKSENGKRLADTIKTLGDSKLFPPDALSAAATTVLVEESVLPGLEAAIAKFGAELPDEELDEEEDDDIEPTKPSTRQAAIGDASPRPLYVQRKVTNTAEILAWAKRQGFESTVSADDLHVTIAYSKQALDWMKVNEAWSGDSNGNLIVAPGGARLVEPLGGEGAVVLLFNSSELAWRHMQIREAGASWDYEEYQPHVTITYAAGDLDLSQVEPYRGKIEFGPEIFEDLNP
ncbi:anti-CBASS protein Acb1 family protein [Pseudomonas sp.]|uniref:anti-CBASS protein Acb1 family protein n=1 Tax=Pseudomonas sp. TaxID=306 RepID=UPI0028A972BD|nr:anti-CBASS Acb1 family protein [Pseudomonas sp.]